MILRPATPGDVPALVALEAELFGVDAWSAPQVVEELEGPGRACVVAAEGHADDSAVLGYAATMLAGDLADLQRIGVRPQHRRRGVARRLLEEVVARAGAQGAERVLLEVSAANTGALAFYTDLGFVEIDRRRRYYRDGTDAVVMQRSLGR